MTIGICSLWHEHTELLPEFIRLMQNQPWDRLLIVDNHASDAACQAYQEAAEELRPGASVLRMAENDVLRGWNAGMAALGTDIVVQMANDVDMVDAQWLHWATDYLEPGYIQGPYCYRQFNVPYLDGCLCAFRREDWERLGGLDTGYLHPGYWSDVDICLRARTLGMVIRPVRNGIRHLGGVSTGGWGDDEGRRRYLANQVRFLQRLREA